MMEQSVGAGAGEFKVCNHTIYKRYYMQQIFVFAACCQNHHNAVGSCFDILNTAWLARVFQKNLLIRGVIKT